MSRAVPRFRRANSLLPAAVPNLWKVVMQGHFQGQTTLTTFYYADGGAALTTTSEGNLNTAFQTSVTGALAACMSTDWVMDQIIISCLTSPTRVRKLFAPGITSGGAVASASVDSMLALVMLRQSGVKGQCGRGRIELPAVPTSFTTAGSSALNVAGNTAAAGAVPIIATAIVGGTITFSPQIVSHGTRTAPGALGASPVLSSNYNPLLGTIRRRKIGRGI